MNKIDLIVMYDKMGIPYLNESDEGLEEKENHETQELTYIVFYVIFHICVLKTAIYCMYPSF